MKSGLDEGLRSDFRGNGALEDRALSSCSKAQSQKLSSLQGYFLTSFCPPQEGIPTGGLPVGFSV